MRTINAFLSEERLLTFELRNKDLPLITEPLVEALIVANDDDPVLFRYRGVPVWFELDDRGKPSIREVIFDRMRHLLARRFLFVRRGRDGEEAPATPPIDVVRDVLALPNIAFPIVERIIHVPVFGPDGEVYSEAGYNKSTRCIYLPCQGMEAIPTISANPDQQERTSALSLLRELLVDFPFVDVGETHVLAAMLVPFARALIRGSTPLHLIEKPRPGTGATLLAQVICDICVGAPIAAMTESRSEDEFSRKIHSKLRSNPSVILLDNLRNRLDSATLAAALTSEVIEDRIIQRSETETADATCLWLGTANNPSLSDEMARRTVPIRLNAGVPRPHLRQGFRHPKLREWVRQEHGRLVWSCLTLIQAWIAAGRPKGTNRLGMYESYSEVIGGILQIAGVQGFLDPEEQIRLEDDLDDLGPLIPIWYERFQFKPVGVMELYPLCADIDIGGKADQEQKIRLGQLLRSHRDCAVGDFVILEAGERKGSKLWKLGPADYRQRPDRVARGGGGE